MKLDLFKHRSIDKSLVFGVGKTKVLRINIHLEQTNPHSSV